MVQKPLQTEQLALATFDVAGMAWLSVTPSGAADSWAWCWAF